ncbi:MAG: HlyD family efflux transporter periplasmic adaptor subunit, partial [Deltaproteobacteria bacterium]|nr:HlyD family efflux transporter periplasmic adaptor subunit [Deltaproteobacteria bacterium]
SDNSCASARLAAEAAAAAEREVGVMRTRATERAPFDGYVLAHLVDEGQTVMPGTPLLQFASEARRLRLRVPASDLADVSVGSRVQSDLGPARVVEMGSQALGPGRLVEVLARLEDPGDARVGASVNATLVVAEEPHPCALPSAAIGEDDEGSFVYLAEGERLRRVAVTPGLRDRGWVAITPALAADSRVVSPVLGLDPSRPIFPVAP